MLLELIYSAGQVRNSFRKYAIADFQCYFRNCELADLGTWSFRITIA